MSARARIRDGTLRGERFVAFIAEQPARDRDRVVEELLGIDRPPPAAPLGGELVDYQPSGVSAIVRAIADVPVVASDVVIDVGSGLGKFVMIVHLVTGARAIGIELRHELVDVARERAADLRLDGVSFVAGDARDADLSAGTVFFLYAPFIGSVLGAVMARLREVASSRPIVVCALGVELRRFDWLVERASPSFWLSVYDSRCTSSSRAAVAPSRTLRAAAAVIDVVAEERER